jgi:hypothetical protein
MTGSLDKTARLWDAASGRPKGQPLEVGGPVYAVAISPDGQTALTGDGEGRARLWDLASGRPKGRPIELRGVIKVVAFSPDGRTVLTGDEDGMAQLWDVKTQESVGLPMNHGGPILRATYSRDGTMVVTGGSNARAQLWLAESQKPLGPAFFIGVSALAVGFGPKCGFWAAGADGNLWLARTLAPVEGPPKRLALWLRVLTMKELDELGAIRSLDLDTWNRLRDELEKLDGPPDRPAASGAATASAR